MHFILTNAAKYDVEDATLGNELGQLGLPKGMEGRGREKKRERQRDDPSSPKYDEHDKMVDLYQ